MVTRYSVMLTMADMIPNADGKWVLYSSYKGLEEKHIALQQVSNNILDEYKSLVKRYAVLSRNTSNLLSHDASFAEEFFKDND